MKIALLMCLLSLSVLSMIGCHIGTKAELYVNEINQAAAVGSGNIRLIKDPTRVNNRIIVWDATEGKYYIVKINGSHHFWTEDENAYEYYLANRIEAHEDGNGYFKGDDAKLYETTQGTAKDLEKGRALMDEVQIARMADKTVAEFGLSEERAYAVANVLFQFGKIQQNRSLTPSDLKNLGQELVGSDLAAFENALVSREQGDSSNFENLINEAAAFNHVSPEQMKEIVEILVK